MKLGYFVNQFRIIRRRVDMFVMPEIGVDPEIGGPSYCFAEGFGTPGNNDLPVVQGKKAVPVIHERLL